MACIQQGDQIGIIWWNEAGVVGGLRQTTDDFEFSGWAPDWWPFTAVPTAN